MVEYLQCRSFPGKEIQVDFTVLTTCNIIKRHNRIISSLTLTGSGIKISCPDNFDCALKNQYKFIGVRKAVLTEYHLLQTTSHMHDQVNTFNVMQSGFNYITSFYKHTLQRAEFWVFTHADHAVSNGRASTLPVIYILTWLRGAVLKQLSLKIWILGTASIAPVLLTCQSNSNKGHHLCPQCFELQILVRTLWMGSKHARGVRHFSVTPFVLHCLILSAAEQNAAPVKWFKVYIKIWHCGNTSTWTIIWQWRWFLYTWLKLV